MLVRLINQLQQYTPVEHYGMTFLQHTLRCLLLLLLLCSQFIVSCATKPLVDHCATVCGQPLSSFLVLRTNVLRCSGALSESVVEPARRSQWVSRRASQDRPTLSLDPPHPHFGQYGLTKTWVGWDEGEGLYVGRAVSVAASERVVQHGFLSIRFSCPSLGTTGSHNLFS